MEFTLRTAIILIILLVAALLYATIMIGWGEEGTSWMSDSLEPMKEYLMIK